ncbi:hypothetical protein [Bradyrhizobium sp. th.b2]|uniref:hypothetical protein n=1 Tax=Bradyrhizobium sp. th-b2 TaxID=172088 RepID=UPI00049026EE|nr:hypothetical protein [Bradyrhizobium sp. th.b2]
MVKRKPAESKPSELFAMIRSSPGGGGLSDAIEDNAFWLNLPSTSPDWYWIAALDKLDRLKDKRSLAALLRSNYDLSPKVREYLADLIERYCFPKGRPRTPAYVLSEKDALLLLACESVQVEVQHGMRVDDALDKVAKTSHLARTALENAYNGKRTSLRKSKARL